MDLHPRAKGVTSAFVPRPPEELGRISLDINNETHAFLCVSLTHGLKATLTTVPETCRAFGKSHCNPHPKHFVQEK